MSLIYRGLFGLVYINFSFLTFIMGPGTCSFQLDNTRNPSRVYSSLATKNGLEVQQGTDKTRITFQAFDSKGKMHLYYVTVPTDSYNRLDDSQRYSLYKKWTDAIKTRSYGKKFDVDDCFPALKVVPKKTEPSRVESKLVNYLQNEIGKALKSNAKRYPDVIELIDQAKSQLDSGNVQSADRLMKQAKSKYDGYEKKRDALRTRQNSLWNECHALFGNSWPGQVKLPFVKASNALTNMSNSRYSDFDYIETHLSKAEDAFDRLKTIKEKTDLTKAIGIFEKQVQSKSKRFSDVLVLLKSAKVKLRSLDLDGARTDFTLARARFKFQRERYNLLSDKYSSLAKQYNALSVQPTELISKFKEVRVLFKKPISRDSLDAIESMLNELSSKLDALKKGSKGVEVPPAVSADSRVQTAAQSYLADANVQMFPEVVAALRVAKSQEQLTSAVRVYSQSRKQFIADSTRRLDALSKGLTKKFGATKWTDAARAFNSSLIEIQKDLKKKKPNLPAIKTRLEEAERVFVGLTPPSKRITRLVFTFDSYSGTRALFTSDNISTTVIPRLKTVYERHIKHDPGNISMEVLIESTSGNISRVSFSKMNYTVRNPTTLCNVLANTIANNFKTNDDFVFPLVLKSGF